MTRAGFAGLTIAACAAFAMPAQAERLISSVSTHQVMITSSFSGTELVLFGSVERDAATVVRRGGYDLIVTVIGPRQTLVTRRKDRVFGIWTNAERRTFTATPTYLAVLSNRPVGAIAATDLQSRSDVGFYNVPLSRETQIGAAPPETRGVFREALIRLKRENGLYREEPNAVTFLTPNLFRASITMPAEAPTGNYEVDIRLFVDGTAIARTSTAIEIVKAGVEQFVANSARDHGFLYGLATTLMALMTGWFAAVVFRKD